MDGSVLVERQVQRGARGRFAPGVSGNPAGKRKGTRNRATALAAALAADEDGTIARVVIDKAVAGDAVAARFLLGLLVAKPRGRAIELDLPECHTPDDIVAAFDVTVAAMAAGEITPDEALIVSRVLDRRRRAIEARARRQRGPAGRAATAATVARDAASEAPDAPAGPPVAAPDLHPACIGGAAPADAPPAASQAPARAQAGPDLHSACTSRQIGEIRGTLSWRPRAAGLRARLLSSTGSAELELRRHGSGR
jgi:hypothetical protein